MKGRLGSRIWGCWGREGFVSSGPLWSWVTGLTQQLAFLSCALLPPVSAGGMEEALLLASCYLALEKGQIHPGKEFPPPVLFNLILRSEADWKGFGHQ